VQVLESSASAALEITPALPQTDLRHPRESHRTLGSPRVGRQFKTEAAYRVRRRNWRDRRLADGPAAVEDALIQSAI